MSQRPAVVLSVLGLAALVAGQDLASQDAPSWLLVRSRAESLSGFSWQRMASVYLHRRFRIVQSDVAQKLPGTSRLVVGTPADNPMAKRLAQRLGIQFSRDGVRYREHVYPRDAGIVVSTKDPDGHGRLVLMTGASAKAVHNCITVQVDMHRDGYVIMTRGKVLRRGSARFEVDGTALHVVRLDRDLWQTSDAFASSVDEAALHASRRFQGYRFVYVGALDSRVDLFEFTRRQLRQDRAMLDATRERFAHLDLAKMLDRLEQRVATALGGRSGPRPIVYTVVTVATGTNARVIGSDARTGRMRMLLNLAAFSSVQSLRLAAAHEFVHTLQRSHGATLLDRSVTEGVAVFVSEQLVQGTQSYEALMWSKEKFAAAVARRSRILTAFRALRGQTDQKKIGTFLFLHVPLQSVPGAPDRCGYYVGWLAAAAWRRANRDRPLGDLLRVTPQELWAALDR